MTALFAKYGPVAIAVKSQHAYERTWPGNCVTMLMQHGCCNTTYLARR
jgi:hypothetical protein